MATGLSSGKSKSLSGKCARAQFGAQDERGDRVLVEILSELAAALLPRGVTPTRFNHLATQAFIDAAAELSRLQNGRVNQSRVAALTGIRRGEIRRHFSTTTQSAESPGRRSPIRALTDGWQVDQRYVNQRGQPKKLPICGDGCSFEQLVKDYIGDVPHRAVLDELRRVGAIRQIGVSVKLLRRSVVRQGQNLAELAPLTPVIADGIHTLTHSVSSGQRPLLHRVVLPAHSLPELELVRERCATSVSSMLAGLSESLGVRLTVPPRHKQTPYSYGITVLLVEQRASNKALPSAACLMDRKWRSKNCRGV